MFLMPGFGDGQVVQRGPQARLLAVRGRFDSPQALDALDKGLLGRLAVALVDCVVQTQQKMGDVRQRVGPGRGQQFLLGQFVVVGFDQLRGLVDQLLLGVAHFLQLRGGEPLAVQPHGPLIGQLLPMFQIVAGQVLFRFGDLGIFEKQLVECDDGRGGVLLFGQGRQLIERRYAGQRSGGFGRLRLLLQASRRLVGFGQQSLRAGNGGGLVAKGPSRQKADTTRG